MEAPRDKSIDSMDQLQKQVSSTTSDRGVLDGRKISKDARSNPFLRVLVFLVLAISIFLFASIPGYLALQAAKGELEDYMIVMGSTLIVGMGFCATALLLPKSSG